MKRRDVLKASAVLPILAGVAPLGAVLAESAATLRARVRPGDAEWPSEAKWKSLNEELGGRLLKPESPFSACSTPQPGVACNDALKQLNNPYFVGDQAALTQTSGWVDAWASQPSAYAVAATSAADVAAAVNFAREHRLRLVVKGGGHSYLGTSNAPDSLLVWTRAMNAVTLHDAFVAQGCGGTVPVPAVSVGAGAMWSDAYSAVTTRGGRYVQGGGCTTVGVAGLVQSGGFGNFSKGFGTAAAGLLEAEVVTADGRIRIANACTNPELFWALKGGGGGSFGVVTRLTLKTHALPEFFGGVFGEIHAVSDEGYHALIAKLLDFYSTSLFNPHWGETVSFHGNNKLHISLVFQGLNRSQAEAVWNPFLDWVRAHKDYSFTEPFKVLALPAQHFWDPEFFQKNIPGILGSDDRANASSDHVVWNGDREQVGWFIHGYQSAWLPANLLDPDQQKHLAKALFDTTRSWSVALHFNKGLAGASEAAMDATQDTATNPAVLDAFALAIIAGGSEPAYKGIPNKADKSAEARNDARQIGRAMAALLKVAPNAGSYVSESDFFQRNWQNAYWGTNYPRLAKVKQQFDPEGLFVVHHGVGSEAWSEDGFVPVAGWVWPSFGS